MNDVINDLAEANFDMCDKNWKKFIDGKVGLTFLTLPRTYQTLTKFHELTGILADTGHNDFSQAIFSED